MFLSIQKKKGEGEGANFFFQSFIYCYQIHNKKQYGTKNTTFLYKHTT